MLIAIHRYIQPAEVDVSEAEPQDKASAQGMITIVDSEENTFTPVGDFRVLIGGVD